MTKKEIIVGSGQILTATVIWGYGFTVIRDSLDTIPLHLLMTWRYLIALIILAAIFRKHWKHISGKLLGEGAILGALLYAGQYFQTVALAYADTTAGRVAFITALYVVFVPFLNWILFRDRPGLLCFLSIGLAVPGLLLLTGTGGTGIGRGDMVALAGSFGLSLHILAGDRFIRKRDVIALTIVQFGFAFLYSGAVQLLSGVRIMGEVWHTDMVWPLIYLGVFSTMIGFLMQLFGQRHLPPEAAAVLLSTESVFGMLFSVLIGGEQLTGMAVLGCLLMLTAVLIPKKQKVSAK